MSGEQLRHRGKGKVFPQNPSSEAYNNEAFEMDNKEEDKDNRKIINKLKAIAKVQGHMSLPENPLNIIANVKSGVGSWRRYSNKKRVCENQGRFGYAKHASLPNGGQDGEIGTDRRKTGGSGLDYGVVPSKKAFDEVDSAVSTTMKQNAVAQNRNLIEYFAALAQPDNDDDSLNFEYIVLLLKNGAKIDCTDKYGQTVLHEAARAWHVDVAKFLIEQGALVNQGDNYGRTPLHVAAAVDYPEMVNFLVTAKADKEVITKGEHQTPVHFAARNDACGSLKALIRAGCEYKLVRDYKGRTPLHLAAELDRSETARMLMELDEAAPAGVIDNSGQSAVVWMITKMPPVAKLALDQFHSTDRANRKQYYHLTCLEPRKPDDTRPVHPQQALQVLVRYRRLELVLHPVILKLIEMKWKKFGRRGALGSTFLNLLFIILWTLQGMLVNGENRHTYILPEQWWRIALFVCALIVTIIQVKEELSEFYYSRKVHNSWKDWREGEIQRDIRYTHPRWPEEEQYLQQENDNLDDQKPQYFNDFWNIFDWICYALLVVVVISHIVDVIDHTVMASRIHNRVMAFNIILIWLRLMKNVRAFSRLGPFIVMISHMMRDISTFVILYILFYIPFFCAFWMLFGGPQIPESVQGLPHAENHTMTVEGFENVQASLFTLFRMTLVDEYPYGDLKLIDSVMTDLLVIAWLSISAIVMINLLIALMSDTFQRVYDNAQANAVMQKAITILNIEEGLSSKRRRTFREYLHSQCNPLMDFYDDDNTTEGGGEDLKKMTFQIKDQLDEMQESMDEFISSSRREQRRSQRANTSETSSAINSDKFDMEMNMMRTEMQAVLEKQRDMNHRMKKEMSIVKQLLIQIINSGSSGGTGFNLSELESSPDGGAEAPRLASGEALRDDEWEKADRRRKKELKKLRKDLEKERLTHMPGMSELPTVEVPLKLSTSGVSNA